MEGTSKHQLRELPRVAPILDNAIRLTGRPVASGQQRMSWMPERTGQTLLVLYSVVTTTWPGTVRGASLPWLELARDGGFQRRA